MKNRLRMLMLATAVVVCGFGAMDAKAAPVSVTEDGGTYSWSLVSNGAGLVTITYSNVFLTEVNSTAVTPNIVSSFAKETIASTTVTLGPPVYTFSWLALSTKTFGPTAGSQAELTYGLVGPGNAVATDGFLNVTAFLPAGNPLLNALPGYDFSPYKNGGSMTMTYTKVNTNIGNVIANGGTLNGTGGFTEIATVPEPASLALLGIGMTGFLAFRRFFKKTSVA
jgi:hypothetical protein